VSDGENTSGPFAVAHLRAENVLAYYRHWLGVCGVIAGALPESQQRFFTAVRSGGARA
jgi:hypothetical protein